MSFLSRPPQRRIDPGPDRMAAGYHNDMRAIALAYEDPARAHGWLELSLLRREHANPVSIVQLGLGAMQLAIGARAVGEPQPAPQNEWGTVASAVAWWLINDLDARGGLAYHTPMSHTYELDAPWYSALAHGEALSLLARCEPVRPHWAADLPRPQRTRTEALTALLDSLTGDGLGLVTDSEHGPILQEYPTTPASSVLNGWMFALLGLYDAAGCALIDASAQQQAADNLTAGLSSLAASLDAYELRSGWTAYDLYPHPVRHVASPFYHRLHIELLSALCAVTDLDESDRIGRWQTALSNPATRTAAVSRKIAFRMLRPRSRRRAA